MAEGFEKTEGIQLCQIFYSLSQLPRNNKECKTELHFLENLVKPHVPNLNYASLMQLMYAYDKHIIHGLKMLHSVQL